jgi:hypothetical protein
MVPLRLLDNLGICHLLQQIGNVTVAAIARDQAIPQVSCLNSNFQSVHGDLLFCSGVVLRLVFGADYCDSHGRPALPK